MAFQTPLAFGFQKEVNCVIVCKNDFSYATFFIKGCCKRAKVSATAKSDGCTYATNAGFFDTKNGCCVGNLITHSAVQTVSESGMVLLFIPVCSWRLPIVVTLALPKMVMIWVILKTQPLRR